MSHAHHRGNWPKGVSGNPAGRPKGSRNRLPRDLAALVHTVITAEGVAILDALVAATRKGDPHAAAALLGAAVALGREPPP